MAETILPFLKFFIIYGTSGVLHFLVLIPWTIHIFYYWKYRRITIHFIPYLYVFLKLLVLISKIIGFLFYFFLDTPKKDWGNGYLYDTIIYSEIGFIVLCISYFILHISRGINIIKNEMSRMDAKFIVWNLSMLLSMISVNRLIGFWDVNFPDVLYYTFPMIMMIVEIRKINKNLNEQLRAYRYHYPEIPKSHFPCQQKKRLYLLFKIFSFFAFFCKGLVFVVRIMYLSNESVELEGSDYGFVIMILEEIIEVFFFYCFLIIFRMRNFSKYSMFNNPDDNFGFHDRLQFDINGSLILNEEEEDSPEGTLVQLKEAEEINRVAKRENKVIVLVNPKGEKFVGLE